jgi:V8-like Glu-specific endopeptidase
MVAMDDAGDELQEWGSTRLCIDPIQSGSRVSIIQHPLGAPKQISVLASLVVSDVGSNLFYASTTMVGSSGSPVFDENWQVIALHCGEGCWDAERRWFINNRGVKVSSIHGNPMFSAAFRES